MKVKSNLESAAGGRDRTVISTNLVTVLFPSSKDGCYSPTQPLSGRTSGLKPKKELQS